MRLINFKWATLNILLIFCYFFPTQGFKKKEFRGKLAIAITANFINRNTKTEASVEEISGVSYIFNQKFVVLHYLLTVEPGIQ